MQYLKDVAKLHALLTDLLAPGQTKESRKANRERIREALTEVENSREYACIMADRWAARVRHTAGAPPFPATEPIPVTEPRTTLALPARKTAAAA
jgi:hypothetical protein